jgi:hypothetical protein
MKNSTLFTPGPWQAGSARRTRAQGNRTITTIGRPKIPVAEMIERGPLQSPFYSEMRANAALIAAAPEMYAALERAALHHQGGHSEIGAIIRDALARARGEK